MTGQAASHYSSAGREADSRSGWAGGFILFFVHNRRKVRIPEPDAG